MSSRRTHTTASANGLVSSVGMNNNVTWQQGIASNWMARPASITTSGATNNLALSNYAYDGAGNITSDGVDAFRYDKVSRLVSGTANGATQTATYDSFGNLKTLGAATLSPTATTNRLPATLASYAANGAVTAYGGDLFDLDPFGMIQAAHDAMYTSKYWVFIYTADDERIWKYDMGPANTSWWKIRDLGGKVLSEYVNVGASWTAVSSYLYRDGTLLGRYAPGTSYPRRWFAVDHLGTPRRTFGENGSLIEAASYFPFGGHATTTGPAEESLRFTSHERDTAIAGGIDYMHARFYAPGVGRFLSIDPKRESGRAGQPQSWNRYVYALGNPLRYFDPDGRDPIQSYRTGLVLALAGAQLQPKVNLVLGGGFLNKKLGLGIRGVEHVTINPTETLNGKDVLDVAFQRAAWGTLGAHAAVEFKGIVPQLREFGLLAGPFEKNLIGDGGNKAAVGVVPFVEVEFGIDAALTKLFEALMMSDEELLMEFAYEYDVMDPKEPPK